MQPAAMTMPAAIAIMLASMAGRVRRASIQIGPGKNSHSAGKRQKMRRKLARQRADKN